MRGIGKGEVEVEHLAHAALLLASRPPAAGFGKHLANEAAEGGGSGGLVAILGAEGSVGVDDGPLGHPLAAARHQHTTQP